MAKNNYCRKGFVEIPQMTLNALKGLLFGNEGVDLSAIIKDLAPNENNTELTSINVGLVYKGLTPKIDENPRYEARFDNLVKYEYVGISLIMGVVKVKKSFRYFDHYNGKSEWQQWKEADEEISCYGFDQWLEMATNEGEIQRKIEEQFKPKENPQ